MKFFISGLAFLFIILAIIFFVFSSQLALNQKNLIATSTKPASGTTGVTVPSSSAVSPVTASSGFHGPTSPPSIIGPSGPPPDY
jgi:hypothetical protein